MVQVHPLDVRTGDETRESAVVFEVPHAVDLSIAIPHAELDSVRKALLRRNRATSLFELWCSAYSDSQYTEVIIEALEGRAWLSVVMTGGGVRWRTLLPPVDAILIGLHYRLPFFMTEPAVQEPLPTPLNLPWPARAAAIRGARPLSGPAGA